MRNFRQFLAAAVVVSSSLIVGCSRQYSAEETLSRIQAEDEATAASIERWEEEAEEEVGRL